MKINKKNVINLLAIMIIVSSTLNVYAKEEGLVSVKSGYTDEGIYYEVYETMTIVNSSTRSSSVYVERTIEYNSSTVIPPNIMDWTEKIAGVTYSGTLSLKSYVRDFNYNATKANYKGYLYN